MISKIATLAAVKIAKSVIGGREKPRKYPWCRYRECPWYCGYHELYDDALRREQAEERAKREES